MASCSRSRSWQSTFPRTDSARPAAPSTSSPANSRAAAATDQRYRQGTYGGGVSSAQMIDWDVATSTGVRWARPGPQVSRAEARKIVAELRELAAAVRDPVREVTGLPGPADGGSVAVVDRPGWIRANVDGFRVVLDPLV